MYTVTC